VRRDCRQFVGDCVKWRKKRIVVEFGSENRNGVERMNEEVIVEFLSGNRMRTVCNF
jgi:hypothetical protein